MIQPPDQELKKLYQLEIIKRKIVKIANIADCVFNDTNIYHTNERLLDMQKIISEALTDCEK